MFDERILFLGSAVDLTLIQRAKEIYRIQCWISKFLERKEWVINGKITVDINNEEDSISKFLKSFKKEIKHNTILKNIKDDFLDNVTSSLLFYYLKYSDSSLIFRYSLGRNSEISRYTETLIYNYELLINMFGFTTFKEFIKNMVLLLNVTRMEVTNHNLGLELQELFGSSVDVQILK